MSRFEFAAATRIIFGIGTVGEVASEALRLGKRPLLITGCTDLHYEPVIEAIGKSGLGSVRLKAEGEPTVTSVSEGVETARRENCDMVIAVGGGSAIDEGKAIAAMLTNRGELIDYLEVIGREKKLVSPAAPLIAVPTTSGTGAEVTRNAVIASPEHHVKASIRSNFLFPAVAIIDPSLTLTLPPAITAATGLDALTQCIEAYVSVKANPLSDALSREGIMRAGRSLMAACVDGRNIAAREDMALASLLSGLSLANAGLGAVHGLAGPIGGRCGAPHGVVCALLLPAVMRANIKALRKGCGSSCALERYAHIGAILTGDHTSGADDAVERISELCAGLPLPSPKIIGLCRADFQAVAADALRASSMKGNPVQLTQDELTAVLEETFGTA